MQSLSKNLEMLIGTIGSVRLSLYSLPVKSVGVMGDGRTYDWVVSLRAVQTSDFMTAKWAHLPYELLGRFPTVSLMKSRGINRVCYDVSGKPPATIEWE